LRLACCSQEAAQVPQRVATQALMTRVLRKVPHQAMTSH
jgi:hypothetical protein